MHLVHKVKRTATHLVVDSSDVLAQQSCTNQLNAAEKEDRQQRADMSVAGNDAEVLCMKQSIPDRDQREKQAARQQNSTEHHAQAHGFITEAEDRVHGVLEELQQRLFGLSRGAV